MRNRSTEEKNESVRRTDHRSRQLNDKRFKRVNTFYENFVRKRSIQNDNVALTD